MIIALLPGAWVWDLKLAWHTEILRIQPCPQHVGRPHYRWPLPQALRTPHNQDLDCTDSWTLCNLCVQISVLVTSGNNFQWAESHENVQIVAACLWSKPSLCCWVVSTMKLSEKPSLRYYEGKLTDKGLNQMKDWRWHWKLWDEATLRTVRP